MDVVEKVRSTIGAYADSDVRAQLKADHKLIRELAKELEEARTSSSRRSALNRLKAFLTAHARAEEQAVYVPLTRLKDSPDSRMAGNEGAVEHSLADLLVGRLASTKDASTEMWRAHAKVLREMLEHHIAEEESDVFEELGEHFDDEDRVAMAKDFVTRKDRHLRAHPMPRGGSRKPDLRTAERKSDKAEDDARKAIAEEQR